MYDLTKLDENTLEKVKLVVVILHYLKENYDASVREVKEIVGQAIIKYIPFCDKRFLKEIDWANLNTEDVIKDYGIEIEDYIGKYKREFLILDNLFINDDFQNKHLYEELKKERENGKVFSEDDLTYDILYELCVVESVIDQNIADLFNLERDIKAIRKKYKLNNKFLKGLIDNPKRFFEDEKAKEGIKNLTPMAALYCYYNVVEGLCVSKKRDLKTLDYYLELRADNKFRSFKIVSKKRETEQKRRIKRKDDGRKLNQTKIYLNKLKSGKDGERIAALYEKNKLKYIGRYDLADKVKIITKTNYEDITLDGKGYDLISYNEKGEKIYIEVKCSNNYKKGKINFFISEKEIAFMEEGIEGIDKDHAFIYFVYNIDYENQEACIEVIDTKDFKEKFERRPHIYIVNEK